VNQEYLEASKNDPAKVWAQYETAEKLLGDLEGKDALDMGCGNGAFTRRIALKGAKSVVAYDSSFEQVKLANDLERQDGLGIKYFVADKPTINPDQKFDVVSAIMVLPCAGNQQELEAMFAQASEALKDDGKFICLTLNPEFANYDEIKFNRKFTKLGDDKIGIDFYKNNNEFRFHIQDTYFSREQVESAAHQAGFANVVWEKLTVNPEGIKQAGEDFWEGFDTKDGCPYIGLTARK
jgi:2-polyprenyl-3-methyl-5-hydroxy-6-metoxy-1,4-benzoquinol methylase